MKSLTQTEKEMIISRLFWDRPIPPVDLEKLIEEKLQSINEIQSQHFFCRLLTLQRKLDVIEFCQFDPFLSMRLVCG